jgi:hypothetical protein
MQQEREDRLSLHERLSPHQQGAAAEILAKHRAARADKPKEALKNVEPAKKVGRVLLKAKKTSLVIT